MQVSRRSFTAATASLLALSTIGCSSLAEKKTDPFARSAKDQSSFMDKLPWVNKKDEPPQPYPNPVKIAATWTPDTLVQTGRTPTRGFGGRIFFYDEKSRPVPVEGTLVIHGFNDAAEDPAERVKRFEFTPEQFTRHFSQTDLGASYSVWVPWDAIGGEQTRVSLVASFKTSNGNAVQGVPATLVLPGQSSEESIGQPKTVQLSPQYQKHLAATESGSTRSSGLTTTTIARRRTSTPSSSMPRGIRLPPTKEERTMIAAGQKTPSLDLEMPSKPMESAIQPVSAQLPIHR